MEARNRSLADWFTRIRGGQVKLPRFQRLEAWSHNEVANLVETVLRGLPAGATLVLAVGDEEQFQSRFLLTAPEGTERVNEHLLDGQQRLTALWRALHDNYDDRTYLVRWEDDIDHGGRVPVVLSQARWFRKGTRYPVWCDDPQQTWERGYLPVRLLNPEDSSSIREWCDLAAGTDVNVSRDIEAEVASLRAGVASYNVPFLGLPVTTPRDVALEVFIKMNTSSVRLSAFDIVVAQLEEATGRSLHDLVDDLRAVVPGVTRYRDIGSLVLDVAAMRSDRAPTQASYQRLDMKQVEAEWASLTEGIRWMVQVLEDESIFDGQRLPTVAVLPVLAALHAHLPKSPDALGNARALIRAYLWRAFLTKRYEQSAATRSLQDFRGLRDALIENCGVNETSAPIFDLQQTPLPDERDLLSARWPKSREILARGVLAVSLRAGARDIADGQSVRADNLSKREYHHLFPDSLLDEIANVEEGQRFSALNCALISWGTNRNISNKTPLRYLEERTSGSHQGRSEVISRLGTHLVPFEELASAGPYADGDADRLLGDYERFLAARARMLLPVMGSLADGIDPLSAMGNQPA